MPMTVINLVAIGLVIKAMIMAKGEAIDYDPTSPHALTQTNGPYKDPAWERKVEFRHREVIHADKVVTVSYKITHLGCKQCQQ